MRQLIAVGDYRLARRPGAGSVSTSLPPTHSGSRPRRTIQTCRGTAPPDCFPLKLGTRVRGSHGAGAVVGASCGILGCKPAPAASSACPRKPPTKFWAGWAATDAIRSRGCVSRLRGSCEQNSSYAAARDSHRCWIANRDKIRHPWAGVRVSLWNPLVLAMLGVAQRYAQLETQAPRGGAPELQVLGPCKASHAPQPSL
jgi:hypothetical protein